MPGDFTLTGDVLTFTAVPDFENPADAARTMSMWCRSPPTTVPQTATVQTITVTVTNIADEDSGVHSATRRRWRRDDGGGDGGCV